MPATCSSACSRSAFLVHCGTSAAGAGAPVLVVFGAAAGRAKLAPGAAGPGTARPVSGTSAELPVSDTTRAATIDNAPIPPPASRPIFSQGLGAARHGTRPRQWSAEGKGIAAGLQQAVQAVQVRSGWRARLRRNGLDDNRSLWLISRGLRLGHRHDLHHDLAGGGQSHRAAAAGALHILAGKLIRRQLLAARDATGFDGHERAPVYMTCPAMLRPSLTCRAGVINPDAARLRTAASGAVFAAQSENAELQHGVTGVLDFAGPLGDALPPYSPWRQPCHDDNPGGPDGLGAWRDAEG